ncbi:MAG: hypothetical protein H0X03_06775, partial [Nitrosopumilus sp.]|nr:hypothetical protein [Nitrosopumilus sp.]
MNYELPNVKNIDMNGKSEDERMKIYRKFFADMRLNRLYFHIYLLNFFLGMNSKEEVTSLLQSNIDFLEKINTWTNIIKENGNFEELKKTCIEELKAIEQIIQKYEERMTTAAAAAAAAAAASTS